MNWEELLREYLPWLPRILIIAVVSLGAVQFFGRLIFPKLEKDTFHTRTVKNRIAAVALFLFGFGTVLFWDYPWMITIGTTTEDLYRYIWDAVLHVFLSIPLYIVLAWKVFPRVDAWLDKRFAPKEDPKPKRKKK